VIAASAAAAQTRRAGEMSDGRPPPPPARRDSVSELRFYHPGLKTMEQVNTPACKLGNPLQPSIKDRGQTDHDIILDKPNPNP